MGNCVAPWGGQSLMVCVVGQIAAPFLMADRDLSDRTRTPQEEPAGEVAPEPRQTVRVVLADDHKIMRQGLIMLLEEEPDIEVVAEAANGEQAVTLAIEHQPDVVVMDISMPVLNGIEATRRITAAAPQVRVIGLSMHETADMDHAIREAGAVGYLAKGGPLDALTAAIRQAAQPPPDGRDHE